MSPPSQKHVVVAAGAFPPPTTGQAKNMALIVADLERNTAVRVVRSNLAAGGLEKSVAYRVRKTARVLLTAVRLVWHSSATRKTLYLVADGGKGIIYTDFLSALGFRLGYRLVLQHRTFHHVQKYSRPMERVDKRTHSGFHVFLCRCMKDTFREQYASKAPALIVSNLSQYAHNSAAVLVRASPPPNGPLSVGLLSNLFLEKGLDTFLAVAERAAQANLPVRFHLAGPAPDAVTSAMIADAKERLGDRLELWGPLSGDRKDTFYDQIDVFMFPTRYPLEAQPNVVLEAQCAGCYVIAPDRGCIREDVEQGHGEIVARSDEASVERFMKALEVPLSSVSALRERRRVHQESVAARIGEARAAYVRFLDLVTEPNDDGSSTDQ